MTRVISFVLLVALAASSWAGETAKREEESAALPSRSSMLAIGSEPMPYERSEFPGWAHTLRRAEVTAIGSLPLTLFSVRVLYDYMRYVAHGFDTDVRPFPFRPIGDGAAHIDSEVFGIILGAVSLSIVIALIDADLYRAKRRG